MNLCTVCGCRTEQGMIVCYSEDCMEAKRTGKTREQIIFDDCQITDYRMEPIYPDGKQARKFIPE